MAVLTAQGISRVGITLLQRSLVAPRTVTMVPGDEFSGDNGDTITLRVPVAQSARTQSSAGASLTADALSEVGVDVTMAHKYHLHNITDQEAAFELKDFAEQVTAIQVGAVSRGVEDSLISVWNGLSNDGTIKFALSGTDADTVDVVNSLREFLSNNEVPADNRWLACSPEVLTRLLTCSYFIKVNEAGSPDALRNAIVGRIFGFNVFEVTGLTAGTAIAYHKSGFGLAVRPPLNPRGATQSYAISKDGIGLRQIFQYNANTASDQSLVSTFVGAAAVWEDGATATDNDRFIKTHISAT